MAGAGGIESGVLGFADDFESALNFLAGFAEDAGASDVGFVALHGAAAVNQNDVAFLQFLRLMRAMGQRGGSAQQHQGAAAKIHFGETRGNERGNFFLRHPFLQSCKDFAVNQAGGFAGEAHELEFLRGFASAARDDDRIGGKETKGGRGRAEMVVKGEGKSFFDADAAGADLTSGEGGDDEFRGAFVFLPEMDVEGEAQRFAHAGFFKGRTDENGLAETREDEGKKTFAEAPTNAREIEERRARADDEAVKGGRNFGHAILRAKEAIVEIIGSEGANAVAKRFEVGEAGRQLGRHGLMVRVRGRRGGDYGGGDGSSGMEKTATGDRSHERKGWCERRRRVKEECCRAGTGNGRERKEGEE